MPRRDLCHSVCGCEKHMDAEQVWQTLSPVTVHLPVTTRLHPQTTSYPLLSVLQSRGLFPQHGEEET